MSHSRSIILQCVVALAFLAQAPALLYGQAAPGGGPRAGRVLWLRADAGITRGLSDLVSAWSDGSAGMEFVNARASSQPEWRAAEVNGRPAVHFDGDDFLQGVGLPTESFTKAVVCQLDQLDAHNHVLSTTTWQELYFGGSDRARFAREAATVTSAVAVAVARPIVLVASYDAGTGALRLYQDGIPVAGATSPSTRVIDDGVVLGSFRFDEFLRGSVAELMVYDHALGAAELGELHLYLLDRYHGNPAPVVRWEAQPAPGQLLQRDAGDLAVVDFRGEVCTATFDSVALWTTRDGVTFDFTEQNLVYSGGRAPFALDCTLFAGRHDYEFALYAVRGVERRLLARIRNVAVGDVYLVEGQSNAVAADYHSEGRANAENRSHWVRSFGTAARGPEAEFDLHWDLAEGEDLYEHAAVGAWAQRLGFLLQDRYAMPIGLINGAVGATCIAEHARSDKPASLETIYGRLLARARAAGVQDGVRGLLWYQGEGDVDGAEWRAGWQALRDAWAEDYAALERIYVLQVRDDCQGGGRSVREAQRRLTEDSPGVYVMSTTAVPGHDGCHFRYDGYREIGERLARALGRDFYGSLDLQEIDPPAVENACWNDAAHTEIRLKFADPDDALVFQSGAEQYFATDDEVAVVAGTVSGNVVVLQLASTSISTRLHYDGHPLDGPWLVNARGVGALAFADLSIE